MMHRDERRISTSKRSRETEAEAVAFVVCRAIGLETGSASQDYIQLYEGDAKLLTASLEYIQKNSYTDSQRNRRGGFLRAARLEWQAESPSKQSASLVYNRVAPWESQQPWPYPKSRVKPYLEQ